MHRVQINRSHIEHLYDRFNDRIENRVFKQLKHIFPLCNSFFNDLVTDKDSISALVSAFLMAEISDNVNDTVDLFCHLLPSSFHINSN